MSYQSSFGNRLYLNLFFVQHCFRQFRTRLCEKSSRNWFLDCWNETLTAPHTIREIDWHETIRVGCELWLRRRLNKVYVPPFFLVSRHIGGWTLDVLIGWGESLGYIVFMSHYLCIFVVFKVVALHTAFIWSLIGCSGIMIESWRADCGSRCLRVLLQINWWSTRCCVKECRLQLFDRAVFANHLIIHWSRHLWMKVFYNRQAAFWLRYELWLFLFCSQRCFRRYLWMDHLSLWWTKHIGLKLTVFIGIGLHE
jgi:hypothetical protein